VCLQLNGKWSVRVQIIGTGKQKSIGTYATKEEAVGAKKTYMAQGIGVDK
jgi:hypothetical protein